MSDDIAPAPAAALPFAGRYVLGDVLGTGGLSTVYKATDEILGRTIALKIFCTSAGYQAVLKRDATEIAVLASLNHPSLVTLYDADVTTVENERRTFLSMELVDGPTLAARTRTGSIDPVDLYRMLLDLSEALHVVHTAGIVHRDITPGNILLAPTRLPGREFSAKLADFAFGSSVDSTRATSTGTVVVASAYLSPEQAAGHRVGPPSDIYSLGLVLVEATTSRGELAGATPETLRARMGRAWNVSGTRGFEWLSILTAMTAQDPEMRPTAAEIHSRVRKLATGDLLGDDRVGRPGESSRAVGARARHIRSSRRVAVGIFAATVVVAGLLFAAIRLADAFAFPDRSTVPAVSATPEPSPRASSALPHRP